MPEIVEALSKISEWKDKATAVKAKVMIAAMLETQFIVGLFCLSDGFPLTLPVSQLLDKESLDLTDASETITHHLSAIEKHDVLILSNILRFCLRRPNYAVSSVDGYYWIYVYIPLLDHIGGNLKETFSSEVLEVFKLQVLLLGIIVNTKFSQMNSAVECNQLFHTFARWK
ncbi:hypothetical protein PR048_028193 [Dryococelus australis]|uniref:Uncharacterized protein n=1 Tax=Dryococelus australis TaxID=614101 RepID=A0ABQ9GIK8_9NEOP|nr:hypothetical protein PR048_028193 [Dryococelus australis]